MLCRFFAFFPLRICFFYLFNYHPALFSQSPVLFRPPHPYNLPFIIFIPNPLIDQFYKNYLIFTENTRAFVKMPNYCKLDFKICLSIPSHWYPLLVAFFTTSQSLEFIILLFSFSLHLSTLFYFLPYVLQFTFLF